MGPVLAQGPVSRLAVNNPTLDFTFSASIRTPKGESVGHSVLHLLSDAIPQYTATKQLFNTQHSCTLSE